MPALRLRETHHRDTKSSIGLIDVDLHTRGCLRYFFQINERNIFAFSHRLHVIVAGTAGKGHTTQWRK